MSKVSKITLRQREVEREEKEEEIQQELKRRTKREKRRKRYIRNYKEYRQIEVRDKNKERVTKTVKCKERGRDR